jgi:CSLREA domain-containing protein
VTMQPRHTYILITLLALALLAALLGGPQVAMAQGDAPLDPRLDLSGNGRVDYNDVAAARDTWNGHQGGAACALTGVESRDVTGDGCVDISDIQLVAASVGQGVPAPSSGGALQQVQTYTVNTSGNDDDANRGDGQCRTAAGECSLRAALQEANARPRHD